MAEIFIATPVFRGRDTLPETLRSIRAQTFTDFHCVVSIDPGGDDSAESYRAIVGGDPRFEISEQPERLGWPGNLNWLVERCDTEYFLYWQQDDLCSTSYLKDLRDALLVHPEASVAYADVQWFGDRIDRNYLPSFDGPPLARVLQVLEDISYIPLRGLIRTAALPREGIEMTRDRAAESEFVFLARLAAAGAFVRVASALYFKRAEARTAGAVLRLADEEARRREWANMGARILAVALDHAPPGSDGTVLALVLDRLAIPREGRGHWAGAAHTVDHVRDTALRVADEGGLDLGSERWTPARPIGFERPVSPIVLAALAAERDRARSLADVAAGDRQIGADALEPLLGWGWHPGESWGAWTGGPTASLELGATWPGGNVALQSHVLPRDRPVRVGWAIGHDETTWQTLSGDRFDTTIATPPGTRRIVLHLPDTVSPADLRLSIDARPLGLGLEAVRLLRE